MGKEFEYRLISLAWFNFLFRGFGHSLIAPEFLILPHCHLWHYFVCLVFLKIFFKNHGSRLMH